jgi:glycosyltransferase involved in cell wall biosynthesis
VTSVFLATPENWFDLPSRVAACPKDGSLELRLVDGDRPPLAAVDIGELQAIHQTFVDWWATLSGETPPACLAAGAYDSFLTASRTLLRNEAEAALANVGAGKADAAAIVTFPPLGHALLADPQTALALFKNFLRIPHSRSLGEWARSNAGSASPDATHAWLRVVLQKAAAEDQIPEVLTALGRIYDTDDSPRLELLHQESQVLEGCDIPQAREWARLLGIDRPKRTGRAIPLRARPYGEVQGEPDVTVLVPSYCHEAFIEETLASVLGQTHSTFRLLVLDDCSPDATVQTAARIRDSRLQIDVNERNLGLGNTVLRALDRITSPYVALLNSDDLFHSERLERCLDRLNGARHVQVVATGVLPIDTAGCCLTPETVRRLFDGPRVADWIEWFSVARRLDAGADLLSELLERNFLITTSNIVCRTEFLHRHRPLLAGLKYCFDWQVFLLAAVEGSLEHMPEDLLGYRLHPANTVWFDEVRHMEYVFEVNRVLAATLRRLLRCGSSSSRVPEKTRAALLTLVAHAAKHSEADGLLLYAADLVENSPAEQAEHEREALRELVVRLSRARPAPGLHRTNRDEVRAVRIIADVVAEEAEAARGSERWAREQLDHIRERLDHTRERLDHARERLDHTRERLDHVEQQYREEILRLRSSPEWTLGDALYSRTYLSWLLRPASRWLKRHRSNHQES